MSAQDASRARLDIVRVLKVAARNVRHLHPRFLRLARTHPASRGDHQHVADLFVLSSCLNPSDDPAFPNHNNAHVLDIRLQETLAALRSVREHHPGAHVVFLENSKIPAQAESAVREICDEFHNYRGSPFVVTARRHVNKGVPQFATLLRFVEENRLRYSADTVHFQGARYATEENVSAGVATTGAHFRMYPEHNVVSTRYFFFRGRSLTQIARPLRKSLYFAILGSSVEATIFAVAGQVVFVPRLGICGLVNGTEMLRE